MQGGYREAPAENLGGDDQRGSRYRHWLTIADCFPDWKFGDYLKKYTRTEGGVLEDYF